jgi:flagellar biosynthesis/type III secretory pathway M-ring protein FliF/YscJ
MTGLSFIPTLMSQEIHFSRKSKDEEAESVTRQASWPQVLLSWSCAAVSVGVILFVVFSIYKTLPVPLSSEKAGKTQFSEQRFVNCRLL